MTLKSNANETALDDFLKAWLTRDPEQVLNVVHPDFVYAASIGPEPGSTLETRQQLVRGLSAMFAYDDGAQIDVIDRQIHGDRGQLLWRYRFKQADGREDVALGCDLLTFREGRLQRKDSYRKVLSVPLSDNGARSLLGPYQRRWIRHEDVWSVDEVRLKAYSICLDENTVIAPEIWSAARLQVERLFPALSREGDHHSLGFVILHQGQMATWLLLNWWAHADIRCQLLSAYVPGTGFVQEKRPLSSCVWEEQIIRFERDAWVGQMLKTEPLPLAYLREILADGAY